ncbi:MAG TPA: translation initiation factor IF-2 N-terminal domain-containing protein, partial [Gemmatimonadaceae bacterium]|nr:translation initiation factor IF-2 N-terminal domain-containing protein [Gemmatimonadaceae bacterium]
MIKLRVHDLAGEFGISNDDLMTMLRSMDVPVRSHLSPLTDEQVARLRARWEREKRARQEKPAPAPGRRRRATASAAPAPEPEPASSAEPAKRRRRRAADIAAAEAAAAEAAEAAAVGSNGGAPTDIEDEPHTHVDDVDVPRRGFEPPQPLAPAARLTPADAQRGGHAPPRAFPDAGAAEHGRASMPGDHQPAPAHAGPASAPAQRPSAPQPPADWQRPRPVVPGPPRPKPVASSTPFPPRPIASAAPGAATGAPSRREEKRGGKRKKGKRGVVDQEAVTANISRTMTALRGAPTRRGPRRADEGASREEMEAQRAAEAE